MNPSSKELDARIPQSKIGQVYDEIAGVYDIWAGLTETRARKRALELAAIRDGQEILEVAVGTGLTFYEIVKQNPHGHNHGIDLSKGMLQRAEQRLHIAGQINYSLKVGTAFELQFEDNAFDILMNNYMFDLIPFAEMGKVLDEFRRVLKPNGKLILVNMTEGERWGSHIYQWIYKKSPELLGGCRGVKLVEQLGQHHFTVDVREYRQQFLFPSEVIRAYKPINI